MLRSSARIRLIAYLLSFGGWTLGAYCKDTMISASVDDVDAFCQKYEPKNEDFLEEFYQKVNKDDHFRRNLYNRLADQKPAGCYRALVDFVHGIVESHLPLQQVNSAHSIIPLAVRARVPEIQILIERDIDRGNLGYWLDDLEKNNKEAYARSLSKWVEQVAFLIRQTEPAKLQDIALYGKLTAQNPELKPPLPLAIWSPLIMNRYLDLHIKDAIPLKQAQFSWLNIIYVSTNAAYREVFLPQIISLVKKNSADWIRDFREEPAWAQFKLIPIMQKVGDGPMKRELIWLSKHHENYKIKTLAQNTLDKLAEKK